MATVAGMLAIAGLATPGAVEALALRDPAPPRVAPTPDQAAKRSASPAATSSPSPSPTPSPSEPLLAMTGPVPSSGPGTWEYASGMGKVLGASGTLRRYRVAVEDGTAEDVAEFAAMVDRVLGDKRSWIASGELRLQRVPGGAGHEFTIYLATADTAQQMCAAGYVDIRIDGKPYTSCRAPGKVILNLDRWRLSVPDYIKARVPLETYREYVINHEVGHELGHNHEACTGKGRPAPTMQTQTLGLEGCVANPWPYVNGKRYAGPPAPG